MDFNKIFYLRTGVYFIFIRNTFAFIFVFPWVFFQLQGDWRLTRDHGPDYAS